MLTPHRIKAVLDDLGFRNYYEPAAHRGMSYGGRRSAIRSYVYSRSDTQLGIAEAEQLRRIVDAAWDVPQRPDDSTATKYLHVPDFRPDLFASVQPDSKPKKGNSIMDRNLPALLRADAKTIAVKFGRSKTGTYTYVTHLPVTAGDFVVVNAGDEIKIAEVVAVDDEAKIEPGSDIEFKWVIAKVDMAAHEANEKRNAEIQAEAATIVRNNMRKSFAQQVLGAASDDQRSKLLALTGN